VTVGRGRMNVWIFFGRSFISLAFGSAWSYNLNVTIQLNGWVAGQWARRNSLAALVAMNHCA